ncbi:hypothetical protein GOP47_0010597 [Adiantum capillus-veneris]|uniref:very-long-chain 3-oxoacyl-CoA synthase n=1 Tax=Adiantum capillus-veneris TaxID=13818 RepID=A0A9D4ZIW4_ADICA|nr:hypothetical protein GOP47_0010597 [Adiantum capillus-veneris]
MLLLIPLLMATPLQAFLLNPQDLWLLVYAHLQQYNLPPPELMVPHSLFRGHSEKSGSFDTHSLHFQQKILERSGLGEQTYLPRAMHVLPTQPTMTYACREAEDVMFGALNSLFDRTSIKPKDIGILIVNCSLFSPAPSLSAMVVNKYKLRGNVRSYTLGGMGCSAGVISIDLAKRLLQVHRNTYALVSGWCCNTSLQQEKGERKSQIPAPSHGNALKTNIMTLGPLVLPLSEQLHFLGTLLARKVLKMQIKSYIPDFKLAFEHFCIHAGGRAVIDELEKNLQLSPKHVEASRMTLHRFGNTSSSSIWYELAYTEAKGRVRKGHRIWQVAFGSGFKCNSAVWRALRTERLHADSAWADCIDQYPVVIPDVVSKEGCHCFTTIKGLDQFNVSCSCDS